MSIETLANVLARIHGPEARDVITTTRASKGLWSSIESLVTGSVRSLIPVLFQGGQPSFRATLEGSSRGMVALINSGRDWARQLYSQGPKVGQPPILPPVPQPLIPLINQAIGIQLPVEGTVLIGALVPFAMEEEKPPFVVIEELASQVPIMGISRSPISFGTYQLMGEEVESRRPKKRSPLKGKWLGWEIQQDESGRRVMTPQNNTNADLPNFIPVYGLRLD